MKKNDLVIEANKDNKIDKIVKGSLYGFIVGDALGVPVEFHKRKTLEKHPVKEMMDIVQ